MIRARFAAVASAVLLAACCQPYYTPEVLAEALRLCDNNQGTKLVQVLSANAYVVTAHCNDGTEIKRSYRQ